MTRFGGVIAGRIPRRGAGAAAAGGGVGGGVGALDDAADAAARKIADREARDWEWQSSWQWEWQQELDVETRGRRAMTPPAPGAVAGEGPSEPGEETGGWDVRASNLLGCDHAHKGGGDHAHKGGCDHAHKVGCDAGEDPAGGEVSGETAEVAAFVGSPAPTSAARRSPFKEPTAPAPVAVSSSAPAAASPESEPEPKVKFGRRARGDVEASRDPRTVPPSPPMPSPPTLTERSPPTGRPGASSSSSYAERREAYRESRAAVAPAGRLAATTEDRLVRRRLIRTIRTLRTSARTSRRCRTSCRRAGRTRTSRLSSWWRSTAGRGAGTRRRCGDRRAQSTSERRREVCGFEFVDAFFALFQDL